MVDGVRKKMEYTKIKETEVAAATVRKDLIKIEIDSMGILSEAQSNLLRDNIDHALGEASLYT